MDNYTILGSNLFPSPNIEDIIPLSLIALLIISEACCLSDSSFFCRYFFSLRLLDCFFQFNVQNFFRMYLRLNFCFVFVFSILLRSKVWFFPSKKKKKHISPALGYFFYCIFWFFSLFCLSLHLQLLLYIYWTFDLYALIFTFCMFWLWSLLF